MLDNPWHISLFPVFPPQVTDTQNPAFPELRQDSAEGQLTKATLLPGAKKSPERRSGLFAWRHAGDERHLGSEKLGHLLINYN